MLMLLGMLVYAPFPLPTTPRYQEESRG
jgi:hypothetical protein